jgi:nicotinate-nucleotide pyrophosphorylase (carboxylating)
MTLDWPDPLSDNAVRRLVDLALEEDLGTNGDVTARTLPESTHARANLVSRVPGVLAGVELARAVLQKVEPKATWTSSMKNGDALAKGTVIARIEGPGRGVLAAERTVLNFLQRLSGIATATRRFADAIEGTKARIYDTRKTQPGWRVLSKFAVRCGGGVNHRMGLFDQVLVKDNHLALYGGEPKGIAPIVEASRREAPKGTPVEIEVTTVEGALEAARVGADIVLLDNMSVAELARAVRQVADACQGRKRPDLEASGGITLETVRAVAETGVDRISVGWITHSAPALDLALDLELGGRTGG